MLTWGRPPSAVHETETLGPRPLSQKTFTSKSAAQRQKNKAHGVSRVKRMHFAGRNLPRCAIAAQRQKNTARGGSPGRETENNLAPSGATEPLLHQFRERLYDPLGEGRLFLEIQIVTAAFHSQKGRLSWNQLQRRLHLVYTSERITRAVHKQRRDMQLRQVLHAQLLWLTRRVQRIRHQQQPRNKLKPLRDQHRALTSAIRMATQKHPSRNKFPDRRHCLRQSFAIACRVSRPWRTCATHLPIRQITTQNDKSRFRKSLSHGYQKRSPAIGTSAVRQYDSCGSRSSRPVQEPADCGLCLPFKTLAGSVHHTIECCRSRKDIWLGSDSLFIPACLFRDFSPSNGTNLLLPSTND